MKTRTADDFRKQAHARAFTEWPAAKCSLCGYQCRYVFNLDADAVGYDAGCYCGGRPIQPRTWQDVADRYNMQTTDRTRAEMDAFWGFASE